jgi:hypothetical protein
LLVRSRPVVAHPSRIPQVPVRRAANLLGSLLTLFVDSAWASSYSPGGWPSFLRLGLFKLRNAHFAAARGLTRILGWSGVQPRAQSLQKTTRAGNQSSAICHSSLPRLFVVLHLLGLGTVLMQLVNHRPVHSRKCHSPSLCLFTPKAQCSPVNIGSATALGIYTPLTPPPLSLQSPPAG